MTSKTVMSGPCCAHKKVLHKPLQHPDGAMSDLWACPDCGRTFWPSGDTGCEQETVRLRAQRDKLHKQLLEHAEVCGESAYPINGRVAVETECRLWTQAEWDLKNKQVDELEQEAMRLRVLLRRFMNCRSEPPGTGWKVAAGANAGDALNKVYLDAKKHFAGSPVEPTPPQMWYCSNCKSGNRVDFHHTSCPACGKLRPAEKATGSTGQT